MRNSLRRKNRSRSLPLLLESARELQKTPTVPRRSRSSTRRCPTKRRSTSVCQRDTSARKTSISVSRLSQQNFNQNSVATFYFSGANFHCKVGGVRFDSDQPYNDRLIIWKPKPVCKDETDEEKDTEKDKKESKPFYTNLPISVMLR